MGSPDTSEEGAVRVPARRRIRGLDAEQRRQERRAKLLESALELFAANGYVNTSIEQICQHAYVGTKGFYEVFDTKEHCYRELLVTLTATIKEAMHAAWELAPADEPAATEHLVSTLAHAIVDDGRVAMVTFSYARGISPELEAVSRANRRWAAEYVVAFWRSFEAGEARRATRSGKRADADARRLRVALGLIGGLFDLLADAIVGAEPGSPPDIDALVSDLATYAEVVRTGLAVVESRARAPRASG